jgi:hypothetical protein
MAYISQERKAQIAPVVRAICKRYGIKASLAINNHRTLVLNISQGDIDFIYNFNKTCSSQHHIVAQGWKPVTSGSLSVNPYHFQNHFSGHALDFLKEVYTAMKGLDYFDDSDIQSDYFHVSHYIDINIGKWNKPYALVK